MSKAQDNIMLMLRVKKKMAAKRKMEGLGSQTRHPKTVKETSKKVHPR